jgi:hypothetical protein
MISAPFGAADDYSGARFAGSQIFSWRRSPGLRPGLHSVAVFDGSLRGLPNLVSMSGHPSYGFCFFPFYFFLFPAFSRRTIPGFCTLVRSTPRSVATIVIDARTTQRDRVFPDTRLVPAVTWDSSLRRTFRCARSATRTLTAAIRRAKLFPIASTKTSTLNSITRST